MTAPTTGWPPGLLQDDDRKLSRWFASRPGARRQAEFAAALFDPKNDHLFTVEAAAKAFSTVKESHD